MHCEIIRRLSPWALRSHTTLATDSGILLGAPNFLPRARALGDACSGPLEDELSFEFCERRQHVPLESTSRR